ncbi:hypothetical protein Ae201684P_015918 [Aphanomyces euteiches]|nr:hypothetical protein Ae201684P_015918 [Aphanomyces euteiches]
MRIVMNLATFNTIIVASILVIALNSIGFFHQDIVLHDISVDAPSLEAHAQACKIDTTGFIDGTCHPDEIATTTKDAWTAIGELLALQWQATMSSPYFVSTSGYDHFPLCQPSNGPQEIAGVAMLETTVRDEFPNGVFMLPVFADKTMKDSLIHVNSDSSTDLLITNINRTLIDTNGSSTNDSIGINGFQYFVPLGNHYKVSTYSYPVVLDITDRIDPMTVTSVECPVGVYIPLDIDIPRCSLHLS